MTRSAPWLGLLLFATAIGPVACARHTTKPLDEPLPPERFAGIALPLDVREYQVVHAEGQRSVFIKLSRLPDAIDAHAESNPARIVLDIRGPTGEETPEEEFPGNDAYVWRLRIARRAGSLQVTIDVQGEQPPQYTVQTLSDWIMVRFIENG